MPVLPHKLLCLLFQQVQLIFVQALFMDKEQSFKYFYAYFLCEINFMCEIFDYIWPNVWEYLNKWSAYIHICIVLTLDFPINNLIVISSFVFSQLRNKFLYLSPWWAHEFYHLPKISTAILVYKIKLPVIKITVILLNIKAKCISFHFYYD